MARIIDITVLNEGSLIIKDDCRSYPVSICIDGKNSLLTWLKQSTNPKMRFFFKRRLNRLKNPTSRYLLKLAIDNHDKAEEIINKIELDTKRNYYK